MTDAPTDVAVRAPDLPALAGSSDLDRIARLGLWLAAAESGSKDPNALGAAAALRIAYAEHLGLPPHAAGDVYVIKGNLHLSARLKRAMAHKHGLRVELVKEDATSCTAAVVEIDTGRTLGERTYTLEMAKKAGLSGTNWTNSPDRMLWARASSRVLDDFAPWVTVGLDRIDDVTAAELDEQGPVDADDIPFGDPD